MAHEQEKWEVKLCGKPGWRKVSQVNKMSNHRGKQSRDSVDTTEKRSFPTDEDPTRCSPRNHSGTEEKKRENSYWSPREWLRSFISASS